MIDDQQKQQTTDSRQDPDRAPGCCLVPGAWQPWLPGLVPDDSRQPWLPGLVPGAVFVPAARAPGAGSGRAPGRAHCRQPWLPGLVPGSWLPGLAPGAVFVPDLAPGCQAADPDLVPGLLVPGRAAGLIWSGRAAAARAPGCQAADPGRAADPTDQPGLAPGAVFVPGLPDRAAVDPGAGNEPGSDPSCQGSWLPDLGSWCQADRAAAGCLVGLIAGSGLLAARAPGAGCLVGLLLLIGCLVGLIARAAGSGAGTKTAGSDPSCQAAGSGSWSGAVFVDPGRAHWLPAAGCLVGLLAAWSDLGCLVGLLPGLIGLLIGCRLPDLAPGTRHCCRLVVGLIGQTLTISVLRARTIWQLIPGYAPGKESN